jgi:hypothetical protein
MQACGSDRVREIADGRVILFSRYPKNGWQARVEKTFTSPEHPGTAIFWDETIYEIVAAEGQQQGGVRYVLEPWRDVHAIRVSERYDEEREAHRFAEHEASIRREQQRKGATLISFLAGHLPALVQEQMASELGMFAHRMTMMSILTVFIVIVTLFYGMASQAIAGLPVHPWQIILTGYLMMETGVRFHMAWSQSRPMGSLGGVLVYSIAYAAGWKRGMASPLQESKGHALYIREEDEDMRLRDAFHMREPLVTLLPAAEQARFAERFDYDYRRHSSPIAWIILMFALAGAYTSLRSGSIFSLLCAGAIAVEQLMRLAAFGRGPAGSVLGVLARPLLKRL